MRAKQAWAVVWVLLLFPQWVLGHGDVTPQHVNTDGLEPLADWHEANPYTGNELAIEIGASAYNQNCARCHGLDVISGGITPDLRMLNDSMEWLDSAEADAWYIQRVRHGAVIQGRVYMPAFEETLSQEAMWAIKAFIETRGLPE